MDWKQFSSSIVGSIAWPLVVVVLLIIGRKQLENWATRLVELSLPGGTKAVFQKALEAGRDKTEELILTTKDNAAQPGSIEVRPADLEFANEFPEAVVLDSFKNVGQLILKNRDLLQELDEPTDFGGGIVKQLRHLGYLDRSVHELFLSLQTARNAAVRGIGERRIAPGEALEYRKQVQFLSGLLTQIFNHIRRAQAPPI